MGVLRFFFNYELLFIVVSIIELTIIILDVLIFILKYVILEIKLAFGQQMRIKKIAVSMFSVYFFH